MFRDNRICFSVSRLFSILGRKSYQNELKMAPKSRPKRSKSGPKTRSEKDARKSRPQEVRGRDGDRKGLDRPPPGSPGRRIGLMIEEVK